MNNISWKGKAFKQLSFGKSKSAGRNYTGSITIYHRGGGSKRKQRRIDFQRNTLSTGVVERIEYDPNRSSRIALIRWSNIDVLPRIRRNVDLKKEEVPSFTTLPSSMPSTRGTAGTMVPNGTLGAKPKAPEGRAGSRRFEDQGPQGARRTAKFFSYILACDQLNLGDKVMNLHLDSTSSLNKARSAEPLSNGAELLQSTPHEVRSFSSSMTDGQHRESIKDKKSLTKRPTDNLKELEDRQLYQKIGTNSTLAHATLGCFLHNIESYPGLGGNLVRAAGTFAQLVQKFENKGVCVVRLPSGRQYLLDLQCRATIGVVSNPSHSTRKLTKAGQSRWLGKRPVVRGVAMNPIDHPHGGGEGRSKGGRPSVSPWGKPTKGSKKTKRHLSTKKYGNAGAQQFLTKVT